MFFSVRTKLLTAVGVIVLIALVLNTLVNSYVFQQQYSRAVQAHAFTLGRGLDARLQYLLRLGIPLSELVGFDKQCQEVVAVNKDVAYAMLLALDGTVLFHSADGTPRNQRSDASGLLAALQAGEETLLLNESGSHYDAIVPVLGLDGMPIAAAVVGIPVQAISEQATQLVAAASVTGSLSLSLALVVLLIVIGRLVVRPLGMLDQSIQAIAATAGSNPERPPQVEIRSSDEFGNIARAFNQMSQTLDNKDQALRQHIDELKQQGQALEVAVSEANAANLAKSRFLANMSHELRTPMNSIIGMVELVQEGTLSAEQREMLDTALHSGESLLKIINDVLDFSKIEANKLALDEVAFDLPHSLEHTLTLLSQSAHRKGLELLCRIDPEVPTGVLGDPGRLRQILTNLISNAIKFTDQGEVLVDVKRLDSEQETGQPCRLQFTVRDTGCGIKTEDQLRLFNAFSQVDNSLTRRHGGTGLGLAICHQLVELMGGDIGVDSEPGRGSAFWFTMPLTVVPEIQSFSPDDSLQGLHALLIAGNGSSREILSEQLTQWGMQVECLFNAEQVQALTRELNTGKPVPAVAIICHKPPDIDGFALARTLRELPLLSSMRLILLSSLTDRDAVAASAAGCDAWLTITVPRVELYRCLQDALATSPPDVKSFKHEQAKPTVSLQEILAAKPPDVKVSKDEQTKPAVDSESVPAMVLQGRVLLAEDSQANRQVMQHMLHRLGLTADVVVNGAEAVTAIATQDYDVILMDCQMPVLDGYTATRQIREAERNEHRARRPVIGVTAYALAGDRERCLAAGMDDYLTKPIRKAQLARILARWLPTQ
ncbi:MAG: ATP-binding protein [Gammaproteobacteria bacterium]